MAIRLPSHLRRARSASCTFVSRSRPTSIRTSQPEKFTVAFARQVYATPPRRRRRSHRSPSAFFCNSAIKPCLVKKTRTRLSNGLELGLITELSIDAFKNPKLRLIPEPGDTPEVRVQAQVEFLRAVAIADAGGKAGANTHAPNQASHVRPHACPDIMVSTAPALSSYLEPYMANAFVAAKPNEKTLDSHRAALRLFVEIVGYKPLHALSVTDQNRFEDTIGKVPANRTKIAMARALSIDEMTTLEVPKLSPQSAKAIAQRTNNFLVWACRREGSKPPFELMSNVRITARSKKVERRAFTDDELKSLFSTATYAQGRQQSPYMYWLPLIGLHTGMRINEIAQLELRDIVLHDGIACFHVTDDDDDEAQGRRSKRVKTDAGRRIVPVHDALVDLGLLDYAHSVHREGHKVLFPELIGGRDGPGQPASKQFARYCDRVGLRDSALVFHSFRHGAVGRMRAAGMAKELRMIVVGHSPADDTHDAYGDIKNDFSVADRKRAIDALTFDNVLNYDGLKMQRPTLADLRAAVKRAYGRVRGTGNPHP